MAPRQPRDTVLTGPEREELLATLRETRQKLVHAGERLKRGCVLRRSLDTVVEHLWRMRRERPCRLIQCL